MLPIFPFLPGWLLQEIAELAATRESLLQQLVATLALGSEAAEAQALALLRGEVQTSLPLLRAAHPPNLHAALPQSVIAAARKAAAALQGLAEALHLQASAARRGETVLVSVGADLDTAAFHTADRLACCPGPRGRCRRCAGGRRPCGAWSAMRTASGERWVVEWGLGLAPLLALLHS